MKASCIRTLPGILSLVLSLSIMSCGKDGGKPAAGGSVPELKLIRALPVTGHRDLEPSGLAWHRGVLYGISDNHDNIIFRVETGQDGATFHPFITFSRPGKEDEKLDPEGIAVAPGGRFLLACEGTNRVLEVNSNGDSRWATPPLAKCCRSARLCVKKNAGLEGIAPGNNRLYLIGEREKRGLLEIEYRESSGKIVTGSCAAFPLLRSRYPLANQGVLDFSGLSFHQGRLYALARNQYLVVQLEAGSGTFHEGKAWSYRETETGPQYMYASMKYGRAEGLAISGDRVYLVLDNNGDKRSVPGDDRRPLLFILEWPPGKKD
jgi:hypothetical protein